MKKYNVRFYTDCEVNAENREEAYTRASDYLDSEIERGYFPYALTQITVIAEQKTDTEYTFETTGRFTVKANNYEEAKTKFWEEVCKLPNSEFTIDAWYREEE